MLQFKKASERVSTLETIGTVASFIGEGGSYELASQKNFTGIINAAGVRELKKVSIKLMDKNGDYEYVNCSKPVGDYLRDSKSSSELEQRLTELATLPILKLPQFDRNEDSPTFGEPIIDEKTGEQVIIYSISFNGANSMASTKITITEDMLAKDAAVRSINFEDLIAI